MSRSIESSEIVRAVQDSGVNKGKEITTQSVVAVLEQLRSYPFGNFGILEDELLQKVKSGLPIASYEVMLMVLAKLDEKGILDTRRQQIGTAGITGIFYRLAEGVEFGSTPVFTIK